jgi:hypothetical protein
MTDKAPPIPGVTLWHRGAKLFQKAGQKGVELTVVAHINDEDVWKVVENKFLEGFRIYTVEDFKGEMLMALRDENKELEAEVKILRVDVEKRTREKELLEKELEEARAPMRALGQRLRGEG